jgi:hypothetical protein
MANQVIPRLTGDDYQHLYSWYHVLSLMNARSQVKFVRVEDQDAGSVDDVTVFHEAGSEKGVEMYQFFYQVKYHETQAQQYSTDKLVERSGNGRSLLQKFWDTWKTLRAASPGRRIELHLVSNWSWNQDKDKIGECISGQHDRLTESFFDAGPKSDIGKMREKWREHLGAAGDDFREFAKTLHLQLGLGCWRQLKELVSQRMEHLRLKSDDNALAIAASVVRDWIRTKEGDITIDTLEKALKVRGLYEPDSAERCSTVYLDTIGIRMYELRPDYVLDWREYFLGDSNNKSHRVKDSDSWNKKMLPELRTLAEHVRLTTPCRLVRARGLARLSAWFAFGYVFSEVAGYDLEVAQQDERWRSDVEPSEDFKLLSSTEVIPKLGTASGDRETAVACGISITGSLDEDVRKHLTSDGSESVSALLLVRPERELGRDCLRGPHDAVALARGAKNLIREFSKKYNATRLVLFYFGPLSGACFIGHQLNAVCRQVQIMEDQQPGYAPAFLLE